MTCQNLPTHPLKNGYQIASSGISQPDAHTAACWRTSLFYKLHEHISLQNLPDPQRLSLGCQPSACVPVIALPFCSAAVSAENLGETP